MSEKINQSISSFLEIEHEKEEILLPAKVEEQPPEVNLPDQAEDYTLTRNTFRDLIEKGNDAIESLTDLAKQSESPRAYEVLATLMKTVGDSAKDLYDLQKKTKDLLTSNNKRLDETSISVDKAVFVGTTAELLRKVKAEKSS
jgi:hypothetical protein